MSGDKRTEEADQPATTEPFGPAAPREDTPGDGVASAERESAGPRGAPLSEGPEATATDPHETATDPAPTDPAAAAPAATDPATDPAPAAAARPEPEERRAAPRSGSVASKALTALLLLAGGGALALWAGPKVAPSLPAPIAAWFAPADAGPDMDAVMAAVEARAAEIEARAQEDAAQAQAAQDAAAEAQAALDGVGADAAGRVEAAETAAAAAADRLAQLEDAMAALAERVGAASGGDAPDPALQSRLDAVESALAAIQAEGGGDPAAIEELRAAVAAQAERADEIAARAEALAGALGEAPDDAEVEALEQRVAALEAARTDDAESREAAIAAAERASRSAALVSALAEIDRAMVLGEPFPDALAAARAASDTPPPAAIEEAAAGGAPTREALKASFAPAAYAAITAALEAEADDGVLSGVLARFEARVTGLPSEPIAGDSAPAVLSRARAQLLDGDLEAALAGVDALPEAAEAAMADWVAGARLRSAADAALAAWRAELGRGQ